MTRSSAVDQCPQTIPIAHRIRVGQIALAVAEYPGDGPPLLLLHGIGSSGASWWPVIDSLAERFRLFVPDWRGHGASDRPDAGY
ncbi:MAG: alpha/beta fold hydrolase, partial [Thermomicrobiales bacterium]|nr:alpha/beta fold hydrolase [Thermomicrobiales bacterium]